MKPLLAATLVQAAAAAATFAATPTAPVTLLKDGNLRAYALTSDAALRDNLPADHRVEVAEMPGRPSIRTGNLQYDALYALAVDEAQADSVSEIRDYAYGNNSPIKIEAFQTGEKWTYVWTRDLSYSSDLAMGFFDPRRAETSLLFKSGDTKVSVTGGSRSQAVQDTGSGGSYPVSSDRIVWALGADATLRALPQAEREAFMKRAYEVLHGTIEQDRRLLFDPADGLYRGEQSFLDWREQTYPEWTKDSVLAIALSKALSVNAIYCLALDRASDYAARLGQASEAQRYSRWAADLRVAVDRGFFDPSAGLYSTYLLSDGGPAVRARRYDLLGETLAIAAGVPNPQRARSLIAHYPVGPFGPPVVWPENRAQPIYHNQAVWPFVTAYWIRAARAVDCAEAVDLGVLWMRDAAARNLSNMENMDFVTGSPDVKTPPRTGPVLNSRRQLWSVAGYLSTVDDVVFGLETSMEGIRFKPYVTAGLRRGLFASASEITLRNFSYQGASINVTVHLPAVPVHAKGPCTVRRVLLNGTTLAGEFVARSSLGASNSWEIFLDPPDALYAPLAPVRADVKSERAIFAPAMPSWDGEGVSLEAGRTVLRFTPGDDSHATFTIYRDGIPAVSGLHATSWTDSLSPERTGHYAHYAIEAVDPLSSNASLLSPSKTPPGAPVWLRQAREIDAVGGRRSAEGRIERWGLPGDSLRAAKVRVARSGRYLFQIEYANGAGPVNTGIACAVKRLELSETASGRPVAAGYVVMPQLGDWKRLALSSGVAAALSAGMEYTLVVHEDEYSRNMSYLSSNERYTNWPGGGKEPFNQVDVASIRAMGNDLKP